MGRHAVDVVEALRVLGLRGPVDEAAVKQAYRRLVREEHPDAGGDAEAFHRVQAAYEVLRAGTQVHTGPPPQTHAAAVDDRWWEGPSRWHEEPVALDGWDLDAPLPGDLGTVPDAALVARLVLAGGDAPRLASRAPGSRLGRLARMLDVGLLSRFEFGTVTTGPRAGHDRSVRLVAPGGRGRRTAQQGALPPGWTRTRGADVVTLDRALRPSRDERETAVRIAEAVEELTTGLEWPLTQWFLVPGPDTRT